MPSFVASSGPARSTCGPRAASSSTEPSWAGCYDVERPCLEPGEVNVGYNVFAARRGNGYASRAVQLLIHHLALDTSWRTATLLIHPDNQRLQALAHRLRFAARGELDGNPYWNRTVPPLSYTDGVVTIRRQHVSDI